MVTITPEEYKALLRPAKPRRYRNEKVIVDEILFDSKKEARRWSDLKIMQNRGEISALMRQPEFEINLNGVKICKIRPDFSYFGKDGKIIEDVKSPITRKDPVYRLKKKLLRAFHGIELVEV